MRDFDSGLFSTVRLVLFIIYIYITSSIKKYINRREKREEEGSGGWVPNKKIRIRVRRKVCAVGSASECEFTFHVGRREWVSDVAGRHGNVVFSQRQVSIERSEKAGILGCTDGVSEVCSQGEDASDLQFYPCL